MGQTPRMLLKNLVQAISVGISIYSPASASSWLFEETERYCAALVVNQENTIFGHRLIKGKGNAILTSAFNKEWNIPTVTIPVTAEMYGSSGDLRFEISADVIDRRSISLGGHIDNIDAFIGGLMFSDWLHLRDTNGSILAAFPLDGFKDAIFSAMQCQIESVRK